MGWMQWWFAATCLACGGRLRLGSATAWCEACAPGVTDLPPTGTIQVRGRSLPVGAALVYGGPVAAAIARMKDGRLVDLQPLLAAMVPRLTAIAGPDDITLVAVPPNLGRLSQRGMHLPDLLAGGLTARGRKAVRALGRLDDQAPRRDDRAAVPEFSLRIAGLGRQAVLVDDVVTTGATLRAAAEVLSEGGWLVRGAMCLADARPAAIQAAIGALCPADR